MGSCKSVKSFRAFVNACDFEQRKHIEIRVLAICWRLSAFKSPSHEKGIFLKIRSFFPFKFFRGHNWLTNYPYSEFHGSWKTVTLSSISPNWSKHWRFLTFWLSLYFGGSLLFLVCHDTAFLFSTRAVTALGWLSNAHRDMIILVRWDRRSRDALRFNSRFLINSRASCAFAKKSRNAGVQHLDHFLFSVFNSRHDVRSAG